MKPTLAQCHEFVRKQITDWERGWPATDRPESVVEAIACLKVIDSELPWHEKLLDVNKSVNTVSNHQPIPIDLKAKHGVKTPHQARHRNRAR